MKVVVFPSTTAPELVSSYGFYEPLDKKSKIAECRSQKVEFGEGVIIVIDSEITLIIRRKWSI